MWSIFGIFVVILIGSTNALENYGLLSQQQQQQQQQQRQQQSKRMVQQSGAADCLNVNDPQGYIDTQCIVNVAIDASSDSVVNFDSPTWDAAAFYSYMVEDGKYLDKYSDYVDKINELCNPEERTGRGNSNYGRDRNGDGDNGSDRNGDGDRGRSGSNHKRLTSTLNTAVRNILMFQLNETRYRIRHEITEPLYSYPNSSAFIEYNDHYLSQTTCAGILAAAMPCVCIYPPIAGLMLVRSSWVTLPANVGRDVWLNDNAYEFGQCGTLWSAFNSLDVDFPIREYRKSVKLELEYFGLTYPITYDRQ